MLLASGKRLPCLRTGPDTVISTLCRQHVHCLSLSATRWGVTERQSTGASSPDGVRSSDSHIPRRGYQNAAGTCSRPPPRSLETRRVVRSGLMEAA